jgi:hypothetical protein
MVNMALYNHAMQQPCKKNDSIYFCANFDFLGQQLTFSSQRLTFVDFSKKCKIVVKMEKSENRVGQN